MIPCKSPSLTYWNNLKMSIKLTFLSTIVVLFFLSEGNAQSDFLLKGKILDLSSTKPLVGASVLIYNPIDSSIMSFAITNPEGNFSIKASASQENALLEVKYIGYETKRLLLKDIEKGKSLKINLRPTSFSLNEVVVEGKQSIKIQGDTITYNTANFSDSTELYVSELVSKLPGVEVSDRGDIMVYGKEIQKLLIDGDDLSGRNYQVLSNNLRADLIDQVEVFFNYHDNPVLADMFKSEGIAMNLVLKESKRKKINFDPLLGIGNDRRFNLDFNIVGLYNKAKLLSILQKSNIGKPLQYLDGTINDSGVPDTYFLIRKKNDELHSPAISYKKDDMTRFNKTSLFSNRLLFSLGKSWKLKLMSDYAAEKNQQSYTNAYDFSNPQINDYIDVIQTNTDLQQQVYQVSSFGYFSKKSRLDFNVLYGQFSELSNASVLGQQDDRLYYKRTNWHSQVGFTQKWASKWASTFSIDYGEYNQEKEIGINSLDIIKNTFLAIDYTEFDQVGRLQSNSFAISKNLFYKTRQNPLSINLAYLSKKNQYNQLQRSTSSIQQSILEINQEELKGQLDYSHTWKKFEFQYAIQSGLIRMQNSGDNLENHQNAVYEQISIRIKKEISSLEQLQFAYSYRPTTPNIFQYFDLYKVEDRYNINRGIKTLIVNSGNNASISYRRSKPYPYFLLYARLNANLEKSRTAKVFTVFDNLVLSQWKLNNQNVVNTSLDAGVEKMILPIAATIKIKPSFFFQRYTNFFNEDERLVNSFFSSIHSSFKTGWTFPINFIGGYEYSVNYSNIQGQSTENTLLFNTSMKYLDVDIDFKNKLKVKFSNSFFHINGRNGVSSKYSISGVEMNYFPKNKHFSFRLKIHNLLNTKSIVTLQTSDYLQLSTSTRVLPRFVMLTIRYSL